MRKLRPNFILFSLLFLCTSMVLASARGSRGKGKEWLTINGSAPLVIARGGFSGIFPDSSFNAYEFAALTGLSNLHVWCDVQLTKDGAGICISDIRLDNSSNIADVYKNNRSTYALNGAPVTGWFSLDFTLDELAGSVSLKQRIFSRSQMFDGSSRILTVDEVVKLVKPPGLWLNIQYDEFFSQHNLSMKSFFISVSERLLVNYLSSPEVGFLRSIVERFRTGHTKLVFRFLEAHVVEPSTNRTYGSLLKNLTFIRTFAVGIVVPKSYIWPVDKDLYLKNHTSLVLDAHKVGLEVFATDFANDDASFPYDYSYDPVAEYLSFIDNDKFSVDGVISDFPLTPSATIDCFSHVGKNEQKQVNFLIISSEGASGDYPGCTDKAYSKAVSDGVDVLDCPVQITNDGVPFCLGSINLRDRTDVAGSRFKSWTASNPELNIDNGIFAYDLTWREIQALKPAISKPYSEYSLVRNPKTRNDGNLMQLSDFLAFANNTPSVSGILISIENAAYLAEKQGLGVVDSVMDALSKAGYNKETSKKIMIKSSDSAVLLKFKTNTSYELVYLVDEDISDIFNSTISKIKTFASSVVVSKKSVFPSNKGFLTGNTTVVEKLQAFNLLVYVQLFQNEYVSQAWDYFSDAYVEINSHVFSKGINGVITDFPATAARYRTNRCLGYKNVPIYMTPVLPGGLIKLMTSLLPPESRNPILNDSDVVQPPLPPVRLGPQIVFNGTGSTAARPTDANGGEPTIVASTYRASVAILAALVLHV
ncbi:glycerophosphodiester phosphodiesterase GDPDL3-like [Primulina eburnea]|uniref:glycerophosphodiester phosphodiesterase GDPDL3-like n=1 Tax=Primulina eburnea TaxID=1245227 RepID=UPI003C6C746E